VSDGAAARRAAWIASGVLLVIYAATMAPDVTFWDAGEFIAASRTLGIPHPPGTPLFIVLLHAWASVVSLVLPWAASTNLFSAAATAGAGGLAAYWVTKSTDDVWAGVSAAIVAGCMTSVWQNATETEVYSVALLLSASAIVAADRAGRSGEHRWVVAAAYLLALSVPLHLSALVAAPVVIYLAARRPGGAAQDTTDWSVALAVTGAALCAAAAGRVSIVLGVIGAGCIVGAAFVRPTRVTPRGVSRRALLQSLQILAAVAVAFTALAFLIIRARHDPLVNQANPTSLSQLGYVISRRQYDLAPLWPRRAPLWAQAANWFEYADWQTALSLAPTVIPSVWRVLATVICALIAIAGARWHFRHDNRSARAMLLLFVCGSVGVAAYLNLRPSPSFGWGVLPAGIMREARERDYFFVLSFWAWGLWAGIGAVRLARRFRWSPLLGVAVALVPVALNWSAVNRRAEPEASEPRELAAALLEAAPARAVLFVAGDNDSYPVWYAQDVLGIRRDVTTVTTPLLAASWYVAEFQRRWALGPGAPMPVTATPVDRYAAALEIARAARAQGRPVAASLTLPRDERAALGSRWRITGLVAVSGGAPGLDQSARRLASQRLALDSAGTARWADQIAEWRRNRVIRASLDPVHQYFSDVLECPRRMLDSGRFSGARASLDSICNF